ncbi:hypothetical protein P171DRAFT_224659 [Karstenula rhodostoma CBS 690.94]|uniref:Uncharacterized protein n=1 Tax=Karstenula rhodostoma CBS 690.94 TaxID=1392251 RepID=A0A9P4PLQ3_9PLEO|nr:hypothetical protein P171DRAFT_224659 [Karstenula rhodostoma CBS 690.94]
MMESVRVGLSRSQPISVHRDLIEARRDAPCQPNQPPETPETRQLPSANGLCRPLLADVHVLPVPACPATANNDPGPRSRPRPLHVGPLSKLDRRPAPLDLHRLGPALQRAPFRLQGHQQPHYACACACATPFPFPPIPADYITACLLEECAAQSPDVCLAPSLPLPALECISCCGSTLGCSCPFLTST